MKKILFVGDDLFNNGQEKVDELVCRGWEIEDVSENIKSLPAGIWWIDHFCKNLGMVYANGKVCRTYQSFIDELCNLDSYDHVVVDLNFLGGSDLAEKALTDFIQNADQEILCNTAAKIRGHNIGARELKGNKSAYGPLVVKKLREMGKSFTIFTRDVAHAQGSLILLANVYPDINEIVEFITTMDKFDNQKYDGDFLHFSVSGKIAAGTKYVLQIWKDFLEKIN